MARRRKTEITVNSLLAAVLYLAGEDLVEERVKDDVPEMNWWTEKKEEMKTDYYIPKDAKFMQRFDNFNQV